MTSHPFVSRAGLKLQKALDEFEFDPTGLVCADFGCNVGGFTDCLLQAGAARVYAIDTGYGTLAYTLRRDERVVVMERTNALHAEPPEDGVDLVVIDLAWTPQRHAIPAGLRWLRPGGRMISLIKPHYELTDNERNTMLIDGRLDHAEAERVCERVLGTMSAMGVHVIGSTRSPITGGKSARRGKGNIEFLMIGEKTNESSVGR